MFNFVSFVTFFDDPHEKLSTEKQFKPNRTLIDPHTNSLICDESNVDMKLKLYGI